jgi:hypothetical protein
MIDHLTFEVHPNQLHHERMSAFFELLGFIEVDASEEIKQGWNVRWFVHTDFVKVFGTKRPRWKPEIHIVAGDRSGPAPLGLTHFCVVGRGEEGMEACRKSEWLEHERQGSGRLWLTGPGGLRVEVRP